MDNRPHAVAIPVPTQGHLTPLLHLCKCLASRGFVITFINTESNQERMKSISENGDGLDIRFETIPDLLPVPAADFDIMRQDNRLQFFQALVDMEGSVVELLSGKIADKGPPVSCLVSDLFFMWPRIVAKKLGVPNVILWTASAASLLVDYSIPELMEHGDIPVEDRLSDKTITYLPGLSAVPAWAVPFVYSSKEAVYDPGFKRRSGRTRVISEDSWVLVNSFEELEESAFQALRAINMNAIGVGPLLLTLDSQKASNPSLWKEDMGSLQWLDKQEPRSVLYISFGSIATLEFQQFEELAAGLNELRVPFIWAIRPKSVYDMQPELLEAFKERLKFGLLVSWAPQLQVLMHPSTGGFLTHCGWNSVVESICGGVPLLCWPCVAEQNLNCKLVVEDWKIGLKFSNAVSRELVGREEIVDVVKRLMGSGGSEQKTMAKLKERAFQAVCEGLGLGSSYTNIEKFIKAVQN